MARASARLTGLLTVAGGVLLGGALLGFAGLVWLIPRLPSAPIAAPAPAPPPPPRAAPVARPPPRPTVETGHRPVDDIVLDWLGRPVPGGQVADAAPGRPYAVEIDQDRGHTTATGARIDLDRDGRWDEVVRFEASRISRKVASADDEWYDLAFHWSGDGWAPD